MKKSFRLCALVVAVIGTLPQQAQSYGRGHEYIRYKENIKTVYGLDYDLDITYMPQYGAPNGKKAAYQTVVAPSFVWDMFDNGKAKWRLNAAYNFARYAGISGDRVEQNIKVVTGINDYGSVSDNFGKFYVSYEQNNGLILALGQYSIYSFDGGDYNANQQKNFINFAFSQNGSESYSTSGLGAFVQADLGQTWTVALGAQDASNNDGNSISFDGIDDEHFATFGYLEYHPEIIGVGKTEIAALVYQQPWTEEQKETTQGWSLTLNQNIGEKWAVFARLNGTSGHISDISQSYMLGAVCNNPLERYDIDQIGVAVGYNQIDEKAVAQKIYHDSEKVLEAYWRVGLTEQITITPDIQFYIHPALRQKSDYATVMSLRAGFYF